MTDNNEKLAPQIRFEGFSNPWVQGKLGDVAELSSSKRIHVSDYVSEGIPFYRGGEVSTGGVSQNDLFISQELYNDIKEKYGVPIKGDLLITAVGTLGNLWKVDDRQFYYKDGNLIRFGNLSAEADYLIAYFSDGQGKKKILDSAAGSSQKALTMVKLNEVAFYVPKNPEQTAIGNFFRTLDTIITANQQKLSKLKQLKAAYLQQMFPQAGERVPRVRFNGFGGEWEVKALGEVVAKLKSYSLSRDIETAELTGFRYIHYGDIHKQVADIVTNDEQLPLINKGDYISISKGDLVLADASEDYTGIAEPCVILHEPKDKIIAGLHTIAIRPINTNSLFLYYLFHTDRFKKFGGYVGTGLKVFGITFANLSKYEMSIPDFAEQVAIGDFFYTIDTQISTQTCKTEQLKQLKSAYLQKMFV